MVHTMEIPLLAELVPCTLRPFRYGLHLRKLLTKGDHLPLAAPKEKDHVLGRALSY